MKKQSMGVWIVCCAFLLVACQGTECKFDTDCEGLMYCKSGVCVRNITGKTCQTNNDCQADEICVEAACQKADCQEGATKSCYEGLPQTKGVGSCRGGMLTCRNGIWSSCENQVVPVSEKCDGIDNDCNGKVDDSPSCVAPECSVGDSRPCYTGAAGTQNIGVCKEGVEYCQNGQWAGCVGETKPTASEICDDNLDNDCNGKIDDGCGDCQNGQTRSCYTGSAGTQNIGLCKEGTQICQQNKWGVCLGDVRPEKEICDQKDNDCNGKIDDDPSCEVGECTSGSSQICYTGTANTKNIGECRSGTQYCTNKKWSTCQNEILPTTEKCDDGKDNDCNGQIDENCGVCTPSETRSCYSAASGCTQVGNNSYTCVSPCKAGTQTCTSSRSWGTCTGSIVPTTEKCDDGKDNDCNGQIDENCGVCTPNQSQTCYSGSSSTKNVGECKAGTQTCTSARAWGTCTGEVLPKTEVCGDGKDNDCDGKIDNGCTSSFAQEGEACNSKTCDTGLTCVTYLTGYYDICVKNCTTSCKTGFSCVDLNNGQKVCLAYGCNQDSDCTYTNPANTCVYSSSNNYCQPVQIPGNLYFGERCDPTSPALRCKSGLECIVFQGNSYGVCSSRCTSNNSCLSESSFAKCLAFPSVVSGKTYNYCLDECSYNYHCASNITCKSLSSSKYCIY